MAFDQWDVERNENLKFGLDDQGRVIVHTMSSISNGVNTATVSPAGALYVSNNNTLSAFGDLRTIELTPIIQLSFEYTVDNTELVAITTAGTGTVTQAQGMAVINTGTTTSSSAEFKCTRHAKYRVGLGGLMRFTALFTTGVASTSQWVGLLDEAGSTADFKNGYAIGYNGATFGIARFQNDTLNFTALSSCDDPLDGTGASGMTLDPTKLNVYAIQFQYLGAGAIKYLVEDDSTGMFVTFHTIHYANRNTTPSTFNPNFHLGFKANNKSTTSDLTLKTASTAYFIEGKTKYYELHQPQFSTGRQAKAAVTTETALFTIKNKTTYASKTNFIDIILERINIAVQAAAANNNATWRLVENATIGGSPSYTDINTNNSTGAVDTAGTTVTGGKTILTGELAGQDENWIENLAPYDFLLEPGKTMTLAVTSQNSATFSGSVLWKELF